MIAASSRLNVASYYKCDITYIIKEVKQMNNFFLDSSTLSNV